MLFLWFLREAQNHKNNKEFFSYFELLRNFSNSKHGSICHCEKGVSPTWQTFFHVAENASPYKVFLLQINPAFEAFFSVLIPGN
jgi:hypothetical protein